MSVKFPNHPRTYRVMSSSDMEEPFYEHAGVIWRSFDLPARYVINIESKGLVHKNIASRSEIADSNGMLYFLVSMLSVFVITYSLLSFPLLPNILLIWVIYYSVSILISVYKNTSNARMYNRIKDLPNSLALDAGKLNLLAADSVIRGRLWLFDQDATNNMLEWFGVPRRSCRVSSQLLPIRAIMVFDDDVDLALFKIAHGLSR